MTSLKNPGGPQRNPNLNCVLHNIFLSQICVLRRICIMYVTSYYPRSTTDVWKGYFYKHQVDFLVQGDVCGDLASIPTLPLLLNSSDLTTTNVS